MMQEHIHKITAALVADWGMSWRTDSACALLCTALDEAHYRIAFSPPITVLEAQTLDVNLQQVGLQLEIERMAEGEKRPVSHMVATVVNEPVARKFFEEADRVVHKVRE